MLVGFELDDHTRPVVLGGLWNRKDTPPDPGHRAQRLLVSRADSRLAFDDDKPSVGLTLGGTGCALTLETAESALTGDRRLVLSATQIEIKATGKLTLSGAQVEITGTPIKLN